MKITALCSSVPTTKIPLLAEVAILTKSLSPCITLSINMINK